MGYTLDILNNIRANASQDYQDRIPAATQENIQAIGNALQAYNVLYNEFCDALINRIGKTLLESKLFKNKLARFKSGTITNAQDVQEIFVQMAKAEDAYKPDGPNPLGRRSPSEVLALYHRENRRDCYVISIGDIDFQRTFSSEATLGAFITAQINSVYSGAARDEYLAMKNVLATFDGYFDYEVPAITATTAASAASAFVKTMKKAVADLGELSDKYNAEGVETWTEAEDLVLLVNTDVLAEVDVEVLAKAFNLRKTDIPTDNIIPMKDFGAMDKCYGILMDKDWFRVWDTLSKMETQRNAHGLFTNYFYHVHQILSASRFKNCVRLMPKAA